eukprot:scaffold9720_cov16-Tisochrysis_lutea.AAC.2
MIIPPCVVGVSTDGHRGETECNSPPGSRQNVVRVCEGVYVYVFSLPSASYPALTLYPTDSTGIPSQVGVRVFNTNAIINTAQAATSLVTVL